MAIQNRTALTPAQQNAVRIQSTIGLLQTILLIVVFVQIIFAGALRALPPDVRASLGFLHRIEWGAYAGVLLILAQVVVGWQNNVIWTNRFSLLAWRFGGMHAVTGNKVRLLIGGYLLLAAVMVVAILWVNAHGFVVNAR